MRLSLQARLLRAQSATRGLYYTWTKVLFYIRLGVKYSTPLKLANWFAAKAQKWLKRDAVWGMPYRYTIDPLNICNLKCPLCPTGLGTLARDRGRMTLEKFQKLVDQTVPYAYLLELYNWGEPFLHPHIFDFIGYASSRKISVRLSSNLNHFNTEMAAQTVASGLDAVNVSVDGATQETYARYRRGGKLDRVLTNIRLLVAAKQKAGSSTPFITLRMLVNRHNEGEIKQMRALAADLGVDAFSIGPLYIDTTNPAQAQEWLPLNEELSSYDYSASQMENVWHCSDLWESVTINWDGGLAPCCWLHDKHHDYENAFERPLKDIWNGEAYVSSRRVFAFGGPKAGPVKTICTACKGRPLYLKD